MASKAVMANDTQLSIAWGITIGLIASFVQSLGLTVQRKSHLLNQQLPECDQRPDHRRPLWLLGFAIFISSNVLGSLFQIASLPVVILAPLGAVSLLWNAFFSRLLLGDVFSPWMIIGTVLIAGGAVLIAIFGIVPEPTHSLEDLLRLFGQTSFIVYFSLLGVLVVACMTVTHLTEFSLAREAVTPSLGPITSHEHVNTTTRSYETPPRTPMRMTSERTPLLDTKPPVSRASTPPPYMNATVAKKRILLAISYASVSGILSGMCLIFAKSGVELLLLTLGGDNQFWRWQAWILVLALVVFALLQLWYLQKALVFADPTIVCPLAFCFYNISSIVNGLVYFDQFGFLSTLHLTLVSIGMVVLLGGVWVVSFHAGNGHVDVGSWQESEDMLDAEEEEAREVGLLSESCSTEPFTPRTIESIARDIETPLPPTFSPPPHSIVFPTSPSATEHEHEHLSQSALLSPSTSSRSKRRRHRYSLLQPTDTSSSTLNVPAGGFSIGLSPISPGFAITPKRRASGFRAIVERAAMRRTLSESNVPSSDQERSGSAFHGVPSPVPEEIVNNQRKHIKANARWKWLRRTFMNKD